VKPNIDDGDDGDDGDTLGSKNEVAINTRLQVLGKGNTQEFVPAEVPLISHHVYNHFQKH
jgi:hypothetical protein